MGKKTKRYYKNIRLKGENGYQICKKCICDTSVPGIKFNELGICNFCDLHIQMEKEYPNDKSACIALQKITNSIKKRRSKNQYDCICGISGGRDSIYTLYYLKKVLLLNPLAVHFNDGFGNPTAGQNMISACDILKVKLITITSDWRESKEIRIAFLEASTPDLGTATDIGIATALFGVAVKEGIKHIIIGQSFRTEGIAPLIWNYLDGKYVNDVMQKHSKRKFREWKPTDPGFNLGLKEMFYYTVIKRIKTIPILYYIDYKRNEVDAFLKNELNWVNTGAHYFDDLYQSLMTYVLRSKFNIDRRVYNYSALIRSKQLNREEALEKVKSKYSIEDPEVIRLCLKRIGISEDQFENILRKEQKSFLDYKNNYRNIKLLKIFIYFFSKIDLLPSSTYNKYFNCGV